ncbi:MAG TPA: thioredoxin domain-containing protein [Actinomycetota bacterium]|nr:thioredoxin domain-containing protein [Actinomycetota bacterium]
MSLALNDLEVDVNERDHVRGPLDAPVTIVEYGDYECPHCGRAYWTVKELLADFPDDVRFVFRNFPLVHDHPRAANVAEALEAAGGQGRFWDAHDWFYEHQHELEVMDLERHAETLDLDVDRWTKDLRSGIYRAKVQEDIASGQRSGVSSTPTFFINGARIEGPIDAAELKAAVIDAIRV